ncbi:P-loop containing nucleoside triphosphate hydrolase protein [Mycena maculata]|uniref:RNA helicase n=1 Tax=Mycena maculata TaxID=230809 RepID=A0AAD7HXH4_9AGAR|nr:P-loop containing nucleoside triphosphate hydrolase protein [Mycena maculata]
MSLQSRLHSKRNRDALGLDRSEGELEGAPRSGKRSQRDSVSDAEKAFNPESHQPTNESEQQIQPVAALREHSRQEYLKKRELQQIELLRAGIADEEALFHGAKLTGGEKAALDRKRQLLAAIDARLAVDGQERYYQMPDEYLTQHGKIDTDKKQRALRQRYEDTKPKEDQFITDVDHWEATQARSSGLRGRAEDKDEYDYVFDESRAIQFVEGHLMDGRKPDSIVDRVLQARINEAEKRVQSLDATRKSLPIFECRDELLEAIRDHQILIIVAETGSGKTTQLPQYLHEAGYTANGQKIGCTQPRRVAAMSVAARVAEEMGTKIGDEVGYSIRFEDCTNHKTVLKHMTDGTLLREFLTGPDLSSYSALIIDEAHERTLNTDILFALVKAKIFEPTPEGARKVILATNIAETSITIDGVVFVIDPGFVKQNSYNPRTGMSSLVIVPCSRASADQRAGRAGRVGPGKAFRLYTKWAFANELEATTVPEIQRTNMALTMLTLKCLGIDDPIGFDFMDPPPAETLIRALEMLYALGALNHRGELTKLGRRMAEFPVDPELSKAIISSEKYSCTEEVLAIVSMLSESGSIFYRPKDKKLHADQARKNFFHPSGDHFTLLNLWNQWAESNFSQQFCYEQFVQFKSLNRARDIRDQLSRLCERVGLAFRENSNPADTTPIQKALAAGYFYNTRDGESYRTTKTGHNVYIHPSSSLFRHQPPVRTVLYYELVVKSKSYMRQVIEIKPAWLIEAAPHYFKPEDIEGLDDRKKKIPKVVGLTKISE